MTQGATTTQSGKVATNGPLITSDKVEGTKVLDRSGKDIGTIKRLKIDKASGRVAYAVAEFGGFLGMGGHEFTIPWNTLEYDAVKHGFSTGLTKEQLEGAPARSRRSSTQAYRASAGGVGTGTRPESEAGAATGTRIDSDFDYDDDNASWDRNRDRELYDYYAVTYYWEE